MRAVPAIVAAAVLTATAHVNADLNSDARLTKSLRQTATRTTLGQAFRQAGASVRIPLDVAGANSSRPFQLFIRGEPLAAVMREVATFVTVPGGRCSWEPATIDGRKGYLLREDLRSGAERARLVRRQREERLRRLVGQWDTALALAELRDEELVAKRSVHPELVSWMPHLRHQYGLLRALSPLQREQLLAGQCVSRPYVDLPPDQKAMVERSIGGRQHMRRPIPGRPGLYVDWRTDRDLPKTVLRTRLYGSPDRPGVMQIVPLLPGTGAGFPDLLHPPPVSARADQPPWLREALAARRQQTDAEREKERRAWRKDPELLRKITVRAQVEVPDERNPGSKRQKAADLSDALRQVADASGLSVIGDYDPCWDDYYSWLDPDRPGLRMKTYLKADLTDPVWEVMESIRRHFGVSWEKRGRFILVRSPRVPYALMDGIDLLDERPAPMPRFPNPDNPDEREQVVDENGRPIG